MATLPSLPARRNPIFTNYARDGNLGLVYRDRERVAAISPGGWLELGVIVTKAIDPRVGKWTYRYVDYVVRWAGIPLFSSGVVLNDGMEHILKAGVWAFFRHLAAQEAVILARMGEVDSVDDLADFWGAGERAALAAQEAVQRPGDWWNDTTWHRGGYVPG